eukprot:Skav214749  [mRNA]  locus=scaffold983:152866:155205:- [translate_table: standard]
MAAVYSPGQDVGRYYCYRYLDAQPRESTALVNFEPVNGGQDQACRGLSVSDNRESYFTVESSRSLEARDCATKCAQHGACQGIEYHPSGRCEIWTREGGIQATKPLDHYQCHRYLVPAGFAPVDGAQNRACRGASKGDNLSAHYVVHHGIRTLKDRLDPNRGFAKCGENPQCKGIEFSLGRCEVWTRSAGIQQSVNVTGFQCYRYTAGSEAGATANDDQAGTTGAKRRFGDQRR